jgi:hypothetical protein
VTVSFKAAFRERDFFLLTLDALRFDVARDTLAAGLAPNLSALLPSSGFERRHTPATFTFAAHQAFFAGFFPTPVAGAAHARPLALRFPGSRTVNQSTLVLDGPCIVSALRAAGYHTLSIGGTGFFNPAEQRAFVFVNVAATHPPTRMYLRGAAGESTETQGAALANVDKHLPLLLDALRARGGAVGIVCSDHGTCFGEDGLVGHRVAHESVWSVPYAEVELEAA